MNNDVGINEILKDLQQRVEDKILEPSNYDLLKKLVENADTLDEAIKIAELGTTYRRTGFHFDKKLEKHTNTISYFKKNEDLSFITDPSATTHKLIIGDNYPALLNLLVEYKGKIDVIYIDPPYGKDSMGEFAQTNYENAISRDNLLSMLYPRLWLAKQLLSENGVIFCSIDDKNHAYVKGLFDEIFGESNFVGEYVWHSKLTGGYDNDNINMQHEFVMVYAKNKYSETLKDEEKTDTKYTLQDEGGRYYKWDSLWNIGGLTYSKSLDYTIKAPDGNDIYPPGERGVAFWLWSKDKVEKERDQLKFQKDKNGQWKVYKKVYASDNIVSSSMLLDQKLVKGNTNGTAVIKSIFGTKPFDNPKPVELIKYLVQRAEKSNDSVILDFFAGSGTTGQAVLEMNQEDDGNRQFILITNNEVTDKNPNGIAYDVTSRRLKRVMDGKDYDGTDNFKWLEKNKPLGGNLLALDIAEVANFESSEGKTAFDVIDETLYGQDKLGVNEKIEWVAKNFEQTQKRLQEK